jgi:hypothetical protein
MICYQNKDTGKILTFEIHLLSMVDACTRWSKFAQIKLASSITTATAFSKNWLCQYLQSKECGHNNSNKFTKIEFQEMLNSYGIKSKPTMVKHPTENAIVERIHGTLGDQLRATIFDNNCSNNDDTFVQACAFALRITSPTQGLYLLVQLTFGYNLIFCQKVIIDWEQIKTFCNRQMLKNITEENKKQLEHEYKVRDKVLILFKPHKQHNKILPST